MSTHPNVILLCRLTCDDLARKTYREIVDKFKQTPNYEEDNSDLIIGDKFYHAFVFESDYHENWQISGHEGEIAVFDHVTYGYGEEVAWDNLETQKRDLESWAKQVCEEFHCSYKISVTANYW